MNVVLDTNVIISGPIFRGKPGQIFDAVKDGKLRAYTSDTLMAEVLRILSDKFPDQRTKMKDIERNLDTLLHHVKPKTIPTVLRDTPDNQVLAIAHEVEIDAIITGDNEPLEYKEYKGVPIMSVDQFLTKYHLSDNGDF